MDRLLGISSRLIAALQNRVAGWDHFWFTPADSLSLGVLRILAGGMFIYTHLVWGLELESFFGPEGWQDLLLVQAAHEDSAAWSFWWYVPWDWIHFAHWGAILILVANLWGLWHRVSAPLAAGVVLSYANRVPQANFGLDQINSLLSVYLGLAYLALPSRDARLTVDRWFWRRSAGLPGNQPVPVCQPSSVVNLATRLIQVHLCMIYFGAGLSKLKGISWWEGTAIWEAAANLEYQSGDLTWLAWHPQLVGLLSVFTVAWEMTFCLLVWNRRLRPLVLLIGMGMHLGIGMFLGMWTFGLIMQFCYVAFIAPETWWGLQERLGRLLKRGYRRAGWGGTSIVIRALVLVLLAGGKSGCRPAPDSPQALLSRGRFLVDDGESEAGIEVLSKAIIRWPDHPELYYELGVALEKSHRPDEALQIYELAIEAAPPHEKLHHNRAVILARNQRFEEAVAGFTTAIRLDSHDRLAWRHRGQALRDLGRYDAALADFDRLIELDIGSPEPWTLRGDTCLAADRAEAARTAFTNAIRIDPLHVPAWRGRAEANRRLNQPDRATRDDRRADRLEADAQAAVKPKR